MNASHGHADDTRAVRAQRIAEDCLRRREGGENLADEQVIAAHPELIPELGAALRAAALIRLARRQADESETAMTRRAGSTGSVAGWLTTDSLPGYDLLREIHRGGQGVVYQAVQKGTKRKVAIKVMREGPFADPRDRARFEREVEILGRLNHPNIVAIHDSGCLSGNHYFVMDYISGQPLDTWVAGGQRTIEETLRLFAKICQAVNAAHLRGVVHRDLKPGNIRIGVDGEPHVLDFGLAKVATGGEASVMTMTGQFLGSLPWAAPEQAEGTPDQIDVRTDVYALGVILYQMLTGKFPYDVVGTMREVLERIVRAQPPRPGTIRPDINDEVDTLVLKCLNKERERRYQSAGELARDIGRYLAGEPIQAKGDSLAYLLKKQIRRHSVAVGVAAAFLCVVAAGSITSLTLWQQAVAERDQARNLSTAAEEARAEAVAQRERAKLNEARALHEAARAAEISGFLESLLVAADPFPLAAGQELPRHFGGEARLIDVLDDGVARLDAQPLADPAADATIRFRIGVSYLGIGRLDQSRANLERALETRRRLFGAEDPRALECQIGLVWNLAIQGEDDAAERLGRETVDGLQHALGRGHETTLAAMTSLALSLQFAGKAADAAEISREMLAIIESGDPKPDFSVFVPQTLLGTQLVILGRFEQARGLLDEAIATATAQSGGRHPFLSLAYIMRGHIHAVDGRFDQAEQAIRQGIEICRATVGEEALHRWLFEQNLAEVIAAQGRREEAARMEAALLERAQQRYGELHAVTAGFVAQLGIRYLESGRLEQAEAQLRRWTQIRERLPLAENYFQARILYCLGVTLHQQDKRAAAEQIYREAWEIGERHPGRHVWRHEHLLVRLAQLMEQQGRTDEADAFFEETRRRVSAEPDTVLYADLTYVLRQTGRFKEAIECGQRWLEYAQQSSDGNPAALLNATSAQADLLWQRQRYAEASALYDEVLALQRKLLGSDNPRLAEILTNLAFRLFQGGDYAKAETLYREALSILRSSKSEDDAPLARAVNGLSVVLEAKGDHAAAEPFVREALALRRKRLPPDDPEIGHSLVDLGFVLLSQGKYAEAEEALRECLDIRQKTSPDSWGRFDCLSALGEALAGQGKLAEAEPLLLHGYTGMQNDPQAWDLRKRQALERIVRLYEMWGKPQEAAEWRAKASQIPSASQPAARGT